MPDMITRCPKCATAFRISDNLLKSAKGMVRCGSCLQVFNAREHLQSARAVAAPAQPQAPLQAAATTAPISITGFLKRQDGSEESPRPAPHTPAATETQTAADTTGLFERRHPPTEQPQDDDDIEPDDDEAWALELLKDDSDLNVQFKKIVEPTPSSPAATPSTSTGGEDNPPAEADDFDMLAEDSPGGDLAPDMDGLLAEIETTTEDIEPAQQPSKMAAPTVEPDSEPAPEPEPAPAAKSKTSADTPVSEEPIKPEQPKQPKTQVKPVPAAPLRDSIAAIEPEPLEVDWDPSPKWKKRLLWPLLTLVALLVLLAQVAWLEFHRLNTLEPYRSFYAIACEHLGCTLPPLIDRSKIETSNLVVRSHPEEEDALKVDVILQNNAQFEQTFPTLVLTFSDLRNAPVASRRLTPDEYLGGELAGRSQMPIKQPIHIGLDIVDPGEQAVSYSIAIAD